MITLPFAHYWVTTIKSYSGYVYRSVFTGDDRETDGWAGRDGPDGTDRQAGRDARTGRTGRTDGKYSFASVFVSFS